jgi:hypothetical protein
MATITKWSNVAVAMQSAIAAAKTITAITKAAPGVVSSTAHGYSNGDYVFLEIQGMHQLNERVFRVATVATDTFQLENVSGGTGIDTTAYDTFASGFAYKLTFGTSITTATSMDVSGGNFDLIDTTTIHANQKSNIPGLPEPMTFNFQNHWDPTDAGQAAMKSASDAQAKRAFRFTFGTGGKIMVFSGYVGFAGAPQGSAQDKVTTAAVITANGAPTYYSA